MMRVNVIVALTILFASGSVGAQSVGDRVRVTAAADTVVGVVSETNEHGLVLELSDGGSREFTHAEIQRLERHSPDVWGAALGGGLGFLVGAAVDHTTKSEVEVPVNPYAPLGCLATLFLYCEEPRYRTERKSSTVGAIALLTGPAIGVLLGFLMSDDPWDTVAHTADSRQWEGRFQRNSHRLVLDPIVGVERSSGGGAGVILGIRIRF